MYRYLCLHAYTYMYVELKAIYMFTFSSSSHSSCCLLLDALGMKSHQGLNRRCRR